MKISSSILGCDFSILKQEVQSVGNSDFIHVDVMDGVFVPNITIGIPVVKSLAKATNIPLDVHLMITKPERYIKQFAEAGARILTIHQEATDNVEECLRQIKSFGVTPGLSIKPSTPAESVYKYLDIAELILVMTVEPGFGGQKLIYPCLEKANTIKNKINEMKKNILTEIDGGVDCDNISIACQNNVDIAVVGSTVFNAPDREKMISTLKQK